MTNLNNYSKRSTGKLLALLTAVFYALFSLMPDSHSLMVAWPWVFIWQAALLLPVIWLLGIFINDKCFPQLGNKLDWWIGLVVIALMVTTIFAEFPNYAIWYSWASLCFLSAIYALNYWLDSWQRRYRLLLFQGGIAVAFIVVSLTAWGIDTLLPELERLEQLREYGVALKYDFSVLELRNWAPLGHQNYVAGYLILAFPLLVVLAILNSGWQRWVWLGGIGLGFVDLYTTSSRAGWLGLFVLLIVGLAIVLLRSSLSKVWLASSTIGLIFLISLFILANNRLRGFVFAIFTGEGIQGFAYRYITNYTGWEMGATHWLTGIGLGNVPWLYQQYLPNWAGTEAEALYQLHSTPAQLWAELGIWGLLIPLTAILLLGSLGWFLFRKPLDSNEFVIASGIVAAMVGYFTVSLTDYQLDNVAISGILVVYLATLASIFRTEELITLKYSRELTLASAAFLVAVLIWLVPIHRAWQLSYQGFTALAQDKWDVFTEKLTQAHEVTPWKAYYPYQLGWNFGDLALKSNSQQQQQELLNDGIEWFQRGIELGRDREFAYSNLGWLQVYNNNPEAATTSFARSAQLLPAKSGVFYGLGYSLLAQNQPELAIEAFTLEVLRDPIFITSPRWDRQPLQSIYPAVLNSTIARCSQFLEENSLSNSVKTHFHRTRGALLWWQGNLDAARKDWKQYGNTLSQVLLDISAGEDIATAKEKLSSSAEKVLFSAWLNQKERSQLLQQAFIKARQETLPEQSITQLSTTMAESESFQQWLKENAPTRQYRRQRLGFNVNFRHMGGASPRDYFQVVENIPITIWFSNLFPSSSYAPELDLALQPQRDSLLKPLLE